MLFLSCPDSLLSPFLRLPSADKAYDQRDENDDHNDAEQIVQKLAWRQTVFVHRRGFQIVVHASAADVAPGGVGGCVIGDLCGSDHISSCGDVNISDPAFMDVFVQYEGGLDIGWVKILPDEHRIILRVCTAQSLDVRDLAVRDILICFQSAVQVKRGQRLDGFHIVKSPFKQIFSIIIAVVGAIIL